VYQDEDGDTVLHEALYKKHNEVVDILLQCPRIDFSLVNKRSFTVLHMATFKGNIEYVASRHYCCCYKFIHCESKKNYPAVIVVCSEDISLIIFGRNIPEIFLFESVISFLISHLA